MTIPEILNPANRQKVHSLLQEFERIARTQPQDRQAATQFAVAGMVTGEAELSAKVLGELVTQAPANGALAAHYAQALANAGQFDESLKAYEHALALSPQSHEIHLAYGMALLRMSEFGKGWDEYEHREAMPNIPQFTNAAINLPRYTGGNLGGRTIYLLAEQGIGDTIMMSRYAPLLAKRGGRVVITAHSELVDLLKFIPGVSSVVPLGEPPSMPVDTYARLFTLPRVFGTTVWSIPNQIPYLKPNPTRVEHWRKRFASDGDSNSKRVGLVWSGNPGHLGDVHRSLHLSDFSPLADVKNIIFYSLQKGAREDEANHPPPGMRLVNLSNELRDFSDIAAALEALDLLITADTAPAHLAGALGRPVWTLVPFCPDWRWMLHRTDSPWYPTMKLFRQPKLRDWKNPIEILRDELMK